MLQSKLFYKPKGSLKDTLTKEREKHADIRTYNSACLFHSRLVRFRLVGCDAVAALELSQPSLEV